MGEIKRKKIIDEGVWFLNDWNKELVITVYITKEQKICKYWISLKKSLTLLKKKNLVTYVKDDLSFIPSIRV